MTSLSKNLRTVFTSYTSLVHAVAGSMASIIAMTSTYPLDVVRQQMQIQFDKDNLSKNTFQLLMINAEKDGIIDGWFKGLIPVLQSLCISNFVYFYTFHSLKAISRHSKENQSLVKDLIFGMIAGSVNVLTTTPFWVVNTRLRSTDPKAVHNTPYNNLIEGLAYIAKAEGILGLWAGTIPSLILVINPAIQFMVYEAIKRQVLTSYKNIPSVGIFMMGATSKMVATFLTYPLQLIQTKLRHGSKSKDKNLTENSSIELGLSIIRQHGVRGLFVGMETKMTQTVLTAALMFLAYEKIFKFVVTLLRANK